MRRLFLIFGVMILCAASVTWFERRAGANQTMTPAVMAVANDSAAPVVVAPQPGVVVQAVPTATSTPAPYYSPTTDAALMAQITLVFAQATDTQIAIAKTETAIYAATNTRQAELVQLQAQQTVQAAQTYTGLTAQATLTQAAQTQQAYITQTHQAATAQIFETQVQAAKVRSWGATSFVILCGVVVLVWLGAKAWGAWKQEQAKYLQASQIDHDAQGRLPAVPSDALGKNGKLVNPNYAHRAVLDPNQDDLSTEQALANTASLRALEATRAVAQSPALMKQLARRPAVPELESGLPEANVTISREGQFLLENPGVAPSFSMVMDWDGKGGIPCGVSAQGLERVDMLRVPHGGVFGKTGTGKSRRFLRTFIAGALAAGQRVVILGKSADFVPFANHPNVHLIAVRHITEADEAARYAEYLKRIVVEMNRRDDYLTQRNVSTWDRAGREGTLVVLDELGNALDMMPRDVAGEALRWVKGLTKEGRKYGLNVWMASQRAVGFKSIVEQLGRAVFHLADADASRHALGFPGAEDLRDGQFFAKFQGVRKCAAFDPTDEELSQFLQGRALKTLEPIDWIEGVINEPSRQPSVISEQAGSPVEIDEQIRRVLERMKGEGKVSLSQAQREVFGPDDPRGGKHFTQVQGIWVAMQAEESATATPKNMPDSGLVAGSATGSVA